MATYLDKGGAAHLISKILDWVYPVGSLYISVDPTSPASLYGGEWERYGNGRTIVAVDETDDDFKTAGQTGGEKTHTLTVAEMPAHNHTYGLFATDSTGWSNTKTGASTRYGSFVGEFKYMNKAGLDQPHNNLQPYISAYIWKRTA